MCATLAAFTAFCGALPSFVGSRKYSKSYNRLELGKEMSSEEMRTKGKKKLPKSKRKIEETEINDKRTKRKKIH